MTVKTREGFPKLYDSMGLKVGAEIGVWHGDFSALILENSSVEVLHDALHSREAHAFRRGWLTVPIHSHGDKLFVVADYAGIRRCFGDGWADVEFEDWRRDPTPLPPSFPQEWEIEELRKMIPLPTPVNDWLLEIRARKKL